MKKFLCASFFLFMCCKESAHAMMKEEEIESQKEKKGTKRDIEETKEEEINMEESVIERGDYMEQSTIERNGTKRFCQSSKDCKKLPKEEEVKNDFFARTYDSFQYDSHVPSGQD